MSDQLDTAIAKLKQLSNGKVTKVPLPDDYLRLSRVQCG